MAVIILAYGYSHRAYMTGPAKTPDKYRYILNTMEVVRMTKADIVAKVAGETGISKVAAAKALSVVIGSIEETIKKGGKVTFVGFGTFSVAERKARKGRNPQTGKEIKIAAKKVPKFSAGAALKAAANGKAAGAQPKAKKAAAGGKASAAKKPVKKTVAAPKKK